MYKHRIFQLGKYKPLLLPFFLLWLAFTARGEKWRMAMGTQFVHHKTYRQTLTTTTVALLLSTVVLT